MIDIPDDMLDKVSIDVADGDDIMVVAGLELGGELGIS